MPDQSRIILDTLGKLHAHGHGLFGYCRRCDRQFPVLSLTPSSRLCR